jgi:hypothetical protein
MKSWHDRRTAYGASYGVVIKGREPSSGFGGQEMNSTRGGILQRVGEGRFSTVVKPLSTTSGGSKNSPSKVIERLSYKIHCIEIERRFVLSLDICELAGESTRAIWTKSKQICARLQSSVISCGRVVVRGRGMPKE